MFYIVSSICPMMSSCVVSFACHVVCHLVWDLDMLYIWMIDSRWLFPVYFYNRRTDTIGTAHRHVYCYLSVFICHFMWCIVCMARQHPTLGLGMSALGIVSLYTYIRSRTLSAGRAFARIAPYITEQMVNDMRTVSYRVPCGHGLSCVIMCCHYYHVLSCVAMSCCVLVRVVYVGLSRVVGIYHVCHVLACVVKVCCFRMHDVSRSYSLSISWLVLPNSTPLNMFFLQVFVPP